MCARVRVRVRVRMYANSLIMMEPWNLRGFYSYADEVDGITRFHVLGTNLEPLGT